MPSSRLQGMHKPEACAYTMCSGSSTAIGNDLCVVARVWQHLWHVSRIPCHQDAEKHTTPNTPCLSPLLGLVLDPLNLLANALYVTEIPSAQRGDGIGLGHGLERLLVQLVDERDTCSVVDLWKNADLCCGFVTQVKKCIPRLRYCT